MATEQQIKELAYSLWEQECYPEGRHSEHYFRAKQMLEEQEANHPSAEDPIPALSTIEPQAAAKPAKRSLGKRRSKKV